MSQARCCRLSLRLTLDAEKLFFREGFSCGWQGLGIDKDRHLRLFTFSLDSTLPSSAVGILHIIQIVGQVPP